MNATVFGKRRFLKALLAAAAGVAAFSAWHGAAVPQSRGEAAVVFYVA